MHHKLGVLAHIRERIKKCVGVRARRVGLFVADIADLQMDTADAGNNRGRYRVRVHVCGQPDRTVGIQAVRGRHPHRTHRNMELYRLSDIAQTLVRLGIPFILLCTKFAPQRGAGVYQGHAVEP